MQGIWHDQQVSVAVGSPELGLATTGTCEEETCFLDAEPGEAFCILHVQRDGKKKSDVAAALDRYTARDIKKIRHAYLRNADLSGLYLTLKNFQYGDLTGASFADSRLYKVGFDFATLDEANFENAILERVDIRQARSARDVAWHNVILDGVTLPSLNVIGRRCVYDRPTGGSMEKASDVYRSLKESYKVQGQPATAAWFYELEMDTRRRLAKRWTDRVWLTLLWLVTGYGERPLRTAVSFLIVIGSFALAYTFCFLNGVDGLIHGNFWEALYFSVITFTTLGYGDIQPIGVARVFASVEALLGIFLISLFVFVFCQKMVR